MTHVTRVRVTALFPAAYGLKWRYRLRPIAGQEEPGQQDVRVRISIPSTSKPRRWALARYTFRLSLRMFSRRPTRVCSEEGTCCGRDILDKGSRTSWPATLWVPFLAIAGCSGMPCVTSFLFEVGQSALPADSRSGGSSSSGAESQIAGVHMALSVRSPKLAGSTLLLPHLHQPE